MKTFDDFDLDIQRISNDIITLIPSSRVDCEDDGTGFTCIPSGTWFQGSCC